jgi:phosphate transport system protein
VPLTARPAGRRRVHRSFARGWPTGRVGTEAADTLSRMRDAYHEELDGISESLVDMANMVGSAMSRATSALLDADLTLAEMVISADEVVDELYRSTEERAFDLMARQQPVASDLRVLVTSLRMVADLERMGDNAVHVAKIARRRYPSSAVPPQLRATVLKMGHVAEEIVAKAAEVIARRDITMAAELERDDDVMDELHKKLFTAILDDKWEGGIEAAIDITLAGRYYERFADHAVSVARRVVYLVTGERPVPAG